MKGPAQLALRRPNRRSSRSSSLDEASMPLGRRSQRRDGGPVVDRRGDCAMARPPSRTEDTRRWALRPTSGFLRSSPRLEMVDQRGPIVTNRSGAFVAQATRGLLLAFLYCPTSINAGIDLRRAELPDFRYGADAGGLVDGTVEASGGSAVDRVPPPVTAILLCTRAQNWMQTRVLRVQVRVP